MDCGTAGDACGAPGGTAGIVSAAHPYRWPVGRLSLKYGVHQATSGGITCRQGDASAQLALKHLEQLSFFTGGMICHSCICRRQAGGFEVIGDAYE
jgi:hypothetical protein